MRRSRVTNSARRSQADKEGGIRGGETVVERHGTTTLYNTVAPPAAPVVSLFDCDLTTNGC
jgi:hypothetical protein